MEREDEVFVDAEEEVNHRRSGRKRRSTAGSVTPAAGKKPKNKMTTRHSPKTDPPPGPRRAAAAASPAQPAGAGSATGLDQDQDALWAKMFGGLESRMKAETDHMKEQLGIAVDTLGALGNRVDKAERRLEGLAEEVNMIVERKLASREAESSRAEVVQPSYAAAAALNAGVQRAWPKQPVSREKRKEESYWTCRRALRLRPISLGNAEDQVKEFMTKHLGLSDTFMDSVGPFTVQRVPFGPAARVKDEVVVTYRSTDVRDAVKGSAKNLAGKGRDYGVRLELPNHLKSAMKAIQAVSFDIKSKFEGERRNVLFDDGTLDLVLDFCIGEGKPWKRITSKSQEEEGVGSDGQAEHGRQ